MSQEEWRILPPPGVPVQSFALPGGRGSCRRTKINSGWPPAGKMSYSPIHLLRNCGLNSPPHYPPHGPLPSPENTISIPLTLSCTHSLPRTNRNQKRRAPPVTERGLGRRARRGHAWASHTRSSQSAGQFSGQLWLRMALCLSQTCWSNLVTIGRKGRSRRTRPVCGAVLGAASAGTGC